MAFRNPSKVLAQSVAWLLVFCVLTVGGLASAKSISHESQHAHHQKATHATALCSWMCAAGHVLDAAVAPPLVERSPIAWIDQHAQDHLPSVLAYVVPSRGPPL